MQKCCELRNSPFVVVRYSQPAPTDEKIDVFYVGGKLPEHDPSLRKVLKYMPGRYVKSKSEMKWTQGPKDSSTFGSIEWDEKRRRWIHTVGGQVLFCLPCDDVPAEETTPAAQGWQATSTAIPAPEYRRYRMVSLGMLGILWCTCHMYSYVTCRKTETSAIRTAMSVMQSHFVVPDCSAKRTEDHRDIRAFQYWAPRH